MGFVNEETGEIEEPPLKALSLKDAKKQFSKDAKVGGEVDCSSGVCEI